MEESTRVTARDWIILAILIVLGIVLGKVQNSARTQAGVDAITSSVQTIIDGPSTVLSNGAQNVDEFWTGITRASSLTEENRKLKALLQRRHSPDLYDFVHSLFFQKVMAISRREVLTTFLKQTIYEPSPAAAKGLLLQLPFELIRGFWNQYLVCPKLALFSFDDAETWFKSIVNDIFALAEPSPTYAARAWGASPVFYSANLRDTIMEGGRLQRLLRLVYDGYERFVEPYSLTFKRRQDGVGREYFYAWDRSGGNNGHVGIKSFLAEKVQSVSLTEDTFEPRYQIELVKSDGGYFGRPFGSPPSRPFLRPASPQRRQSTSRYGMTYTVECSYCGKRFKRNSYDTKLNEHKDKYGNRCFGRIGHMV